MVYKTSAKKRAADAQYRAVNRDKIRAAKKARYQKHREEILVEQKAYHTQNHEKILARQAAYRAAHQEELAAKSRAYAAKNAACIKARRAAKHAANPQARLPYKKAWAAAHPEKIREKWGRERARKKNAPINDFTEAQWEEIKAVYNHRCVYCPPTCPRCRKKTHPLTRDHIIPLSGGGPHTYSNIVLACRSCNSKKHTSPATKPVQPLLLTVQASRKKRTVNRRVLPSKDPESSPPH